MAEYVDREALLKLIRPDDPDADKAAVTIATAKELCRSLANRVPAVDAVEVVRCKDCKHGMKSHLQPPYEEKTHLCRHDWNGTYHKPDHFCADGERKDNEN